ncbi:unnamed protein product [Oikopleura dioica]|uniref:Uncharacterized protein n=1 Tax=Oikopleura dioica TaxID=34765 RepID=E4WU99_OIKDI|nr:unnamed protein product [Oikopleura dioica]
MKRINSKLESDFLENKRIIEQLAEANELERENYENKMVELRQLNTKLNSELEEARKTIMLLKTNSESERREFKDEAKKMEKEIKMLRQKCGDMPGIGHFWPSEKKGVKDFMEKEELTTVLHLLSTGEKKVHLKFMRQYNWKVEEAGWTLQFKTATEDGHYYLWIGNKETRGLKFKASCQEICKIDGEEANQQELKSAKDGLRQCIKYKRLTFFDYVRFNLTFL